jgi:hypothetical protein
MRIDRTRWTIAPWFHCAIAERMGWDAVARAELRGGVAFCPQCGGTKVNHREALVRDGHVVSIAD